MGFPPAELARARAPPPATPASPGPSLPVEETPEKSPAPDARLGAALRGSLFGRANVAMLNASERQRCHDSYAFKAGDSPGPRFGVDPKVLAEFDDNARRAAFLSQPFLSEKPKNGCRAVVTHKDYYVPNSSKEDMTAGLACGKSF